MNTHQNIVVGFTVEVMDPIKLNSAVAVLPRKSTLVKIKLKIIIRVII